MTKLFQFAGPLIGALRRNPGGSSAGIIVGSILTALGVSPELQHRAADYLILIAGWLKQ